MTCCCSEQRASTYTSVADASSLWTRKVNTTILVTVYIALCCYSGLRPPLKNARVDCRRRGVPSGTVRTKKRSEASTLSPKAKWPFSKLIRESHQRLVTMNQQVWRVQNSAWPLNHNHAPAAFTPRKCSWYSFSLEAESTLEPWYGRKEYVTEKSSDTTGNRSRDRPTSSAVP